MHIYAYFLIYYGYVCNTTIIYTHAFPVFRVHGSGFRVQGSGPGFRVQGSGFTALFGMPMCGMAWLAILPRGVRFRIKRFV